MGLQGQDGEYCSRLYTVDLVFFNMQGWGETLLKRVFGF
jgi:hypothetical protein